MLKFGAVFTLGRTSIKGIYIVLLLLSRVVKVRMVIFLSHAN